MAHMVPDGWPTKLFSELVWSGSDFKDESKYVHNLNADELREIENALVHFKALGLDGDEVSEDNFPLPVLNSKLSSLALQLHQGRGFFSIRGLDPANYTAEDNVLIFLGISSYVGDQRARQDDDGNMLSHVRPVKHATIPREILPVRASNLRSAFHTDMFCNILAMQVRTCANAGGNHILASAWKVYNDLAANRPDIIAALAAKNWPFDRQSRYHNSPRRPVMYYHGGRIIMSFDRRPLEGVPGISRPDDLPPLTDDQMDALDAVQHVAEQNQLKLCMKPGDLIFVNNLGVLHARDAFEDTPARGGSRHLIRMWLKNSLQAWKLPRVLQNASERDFDEDVQDLWNVLPVPKLRYNIHDVLIS